MLILTEEIRNRVDSKGNQIDFFNLDVIDLLN